MTREELKPGMWVRRRGTRAPLKVSAVGIAGFALEGRRIPGITGFSGHQWSEIGDFESVPATPRNIRVQPQ